MFKNLQIAVLIFIFGVGITNAQQTDSADSATGNTSAKQKQTEEINKNEFYGGYSYQRFDVFPKMDFHGVEVAYTRNVRRYVGLKVDVAARFSSQACPECQPGFEVKATQYAFQGGVQIKDNSKETRVKPFGHALIGIARQQEKFCNGSNCVYSGPVFKPFSMTIGGGLDIKINKRVDIRAIQIDYNPAFKDGFRYHNLNVGLGVVFH